MNFLKNQNITTRVNLIISFSFILIFIVFGFVFYFVQKDEILIENQKKMENEVQDLAKLFDYELNKDKQIVQNALRIFSYQIRNINEITELDSTIDVEAVNQSTKEKSQTQLKEWIIDGQRLSENNEMVDKIQMLTGTFASVYQKLPEGYIRISTNLLNQKNERALHVLISNNSPVIEMIENGEIYEGQEYFDNTWYHVGYKPLLIKGKIKGMICVGIKEETSQELKKIILEKIYFNAGYAFVIDKNGLFTIHPTNSGQSIYKSNLFKQLQTNKKEVVNLRYLWPENSTGKWKIMSYLYHPAIEKFICVSYYEDELFDIISILRNKVLITIILASVLIIIIITTILRSISKNLKLINQNIISIASGEKINEFKYPKNDEIGLIFKSLNKLNAGLQKISNFSVQLKSGNLKSEFTPLSENDTLGKSLLEMRNNLIQVSAEEEKRKTEDAIRSWTNEGLAKFVEILKLNIVNLEDLAYRIISNMVKYLNANQGGIFVVNDDDPNNIFLEQAATYAFDQKRIMQKKIPVGPSLISRALLEKKTVVLSEVPDQYTTITSGLGDSTPKYIAIVPLIFNDIVYAIIELASFYELKNYQIEFIERIGESIASTISSVKINTKTTELLAQSQAQSIKMAEQEKEMRQNLKEMQLIQDESERKSTEMRGVINAINSTSIVIEYSPDEIILNVNERFVEIFGVDANRVIGHKHTDFSSFKDDSEDYIQLWTSLRNGQSRNVIELIRGISGEVWLSQTFTPLIDNSGKVFKILNIAMNITENKILERQLRKQVKEMHEQENYVEQKMNELKELERKLTKQEKNLSTLTHAVNSTFITCEINIDGIIISTNENFNFSMGFTPNQIIGSNFRKYIKREMIEQINQYIYEASIGKHVSATLIMINKKSVELNVTSHFSPIKDDDNVIRKIYIFLS